MPIKSPQLELVRQAGPAEGPLFQRQKYTHAPVEYNHVMDVCSGNAFRSRIAEGFRRQQLDELEERRVIPCSSGTMADYIRRGDLPLEVMREVVQLGFQRNKFSGNVMHEASYPMYMRARKLADNGKFDTPEAELKAAREAFEYVYPIFAQEEKQAREKIASRFDLRLKGFPEQTQARKDIVAVLGMTDKHVEAVGKIWGKANIPIPSVLSTLGAYATGEDINVPDPFGRDLKAYEGCAEQIRHLVRLSTPIMLEELDARTTY